MYVLDNGMEGFDLCSLLDHSLIRSYQAVGPALHYPLQVCFAEDADLVVGGSNEGKLFVFCRNSGKLHQTLSIPSGRLVQTVMVRLSCMPGLMLLIYLALDCITWRSSPHICGLFRAQPAWNYLCMGTERYSHAQDTRTRYRYTACYHFAKC